VEVTSSDQHSSLLQYGINYDPNKFLVRAPGANVIKHLQP